MNSYLAPEVILKTYGNDYELMTKCLLEEAVLSECILSKQDTKGQCLDHNARIGIKPNLVSPTPADMGATTHPGIIRGIVLYLREHGFHNITMMEGSWVGDKTEESFYICGYDKLCEELELPFVDGQKDGWHEKDCAGLTLRICDVADTVDFMINVPVLKGHGQTRMTCALKNMKGLLPNSEKRHFHAMGLHKPIAHLAIGIPQDFIVVDHICGDPCSEDGGNPVYTNCIMVSRDPVLIDSYALKLLGLNPEEVPYVQHAAELGVGSAELDKAVIRCINDEGAINSRTSAAAEASLTLKHRMTNVYDEVEQVDSCSACYAYLIPALDRLEAEGLLGELLEKIPDHKICIGQGHKGQGGHLGIGNCTRKFDYSVPGCPPDDEEIYEKLKKYLLIS